MPPLRIPIDGLWRCLCPSIDVIAFQQFTTRRFSFSSQVCGRRPKYQCHEKRDVRPRSFHSSPLNLEENDTNRLPYAGKRRVRIISKLTPDQYQHIPLSRIYDQLQRMRNTEGGYQAILDIVEHLIAVRGEQPTALHYEALIYANADAEQGSVEAVKDLLREMNEEGIGRNSSVYHSVLQVLAIHPDYLLRNEMLQEMRERWFGLSPDGWHNLVAGLLRDRQYEMAMDKLDQMHSDEIPVQAWLYDIFLYKLCHAGELDEALQLLIYRFQKHHQFGTICLTNLAELFMQVIFLLYEGTKYIWNLRVSSSYLNPSDGICANVLNLAARYADPILATAAVKRLSSRRTALSSFHFEALLAAYTGAEDLTTAFRILNIMEKAKIKPESASTRPIYTYLSQSPSRPKQAWHVIQDLFTQGHPIHVAAVNVIIEGAIANDSFEEAMGYYKELHKFCAKGPSTETFNIIFQGAEKCENMKSTAMFLVKEMIAAGVKADFLTYDRLILICLKEDDYEDAFRYLDEMIEVGKDKFENGQKGWWMRRGTAGLMVRRCAEKGDERAKLILDQISKRLYRGQMASKRWLDAMYDLVEQKLARKERSVEEGSVEEGSVEEGSVEEGSVEEGSAKGNVSQAGESYMEGKSEVQPGSAQHRPFVIYKV
ncbi:hypothetical protein HYFRA_00000726 [Hymenoscyphus fraxineus]|uniref:Pentatricopeptide repeat-containing protein-mitochondrial domain-containing protein n=1 Tax=Hymenoscyphus fraxineus TaxID=746836 RepID=A0A9N9KRW5_9HELO|nr:hypothetical protein HYFRA_00000726 [Hymenoscyphus fraxineus]